MTVTTSDADARFDRTIDRWFRDQVAMRPETATHLGIHDHDGELSSGGRDAIEDEIAFYRRTIDEVSAIDPGELSAERALPNGVGEVLDDRERDVGVEQGEPDVPDRLVDVGLREAPLRTEVREGGGQAVGQAREHRTRLTGVTAAARPHPAGDTFTSRR